MGTWGYESEIGDQLALASESMAWRQCWMEGMHGQIDLCLVGDGAGLFVVHGIPFDSIDAGGHLVCDLLTGSQGGCKLADEGPRSPGSWFCTSAAGRVCACMKHRYS